MAVELGAIEVHVAQITRAVAPGLIVEVRRRGIAALAAGADGLRLHPIAELDDRHEAVAAAAVHLFRARIRARAERGERSPPRRREADRYAGRRVAERLDDGAGEALVAIDVAPGR